MNDDSTFRLPASTWSPALVTTTAALVAVTTIVSLMPGGSFRDERTVPDVIGEDASSAYYALREAGFAIRIEEPIAIWTARVSEQSVAAGSKAPRNGIIVLKLGGFIGPGRLPLGGWTPRMPTLVGKPLPEAADILASDGLHWSVGLLPSLPAGTQPTLLHNYEVSAQKPKAGKPFRATVWRETAEGDLITTTTTVSLAAKLRPRPSSG